MSGPLVAFPARARGPPGRLFTRVEALGPGHTLELVVVAFGGLEDPLLALHPGGGPDNAGLVAQGLQGGLHVRGHGGRDGDLLLGDGVLEAQQLGMQGLAVQQGAFRAVDLVAQQGKAPVRELHADLVAAAGLQLHFHHRVARQPLDHAVVGHGLLGAGGHALAAAGPLAGRGHGHLQGLGMLDEMPGQGAAVLGQLAHQDGEVDPLEAMQLEMFLEAVEGLGSLGEDQHAAGEAVQAVHDVELETLEAAAAVGLGDGLGQAGLAGLFRGHREQARGLVDEEQVGVFPQVLEGAGLELARRGHHLVGLLGIEGHLHGVAGLEAMAVLVDGLAVDGHTVAVDEALGLPVADDHDPVQLRGQCRAFVFRLPLPFDACHGAALRHRPAS